jgi:gamma-carbonic anhydrase
MEPTQIYEQQLIAYRGITPRLHPTVFVASGAFIIGDVEIGEYSSVWFNAVVRGDVNIIRIGERVNVQDLCMLHVTHKKYSLTIGSDVTIGHSATVHGCTISDKVLIGMGARVLDAAVIGQNSLIAAGAVVREGMKIPEGVLVAGVPARVIRDLTDEEVLQIEQSATNYVNYVRTYREGS